MNDSHQTKLYSTCLLLSVADADEVLDKLELDTIKDIIQDFFSITEIDAQNLIEFA